MDMQLTGNYFPSPALKNIVFSLASMISTIQVYDFWVYISMYRPDIIGSLLERYGELLQQGPGSKMFFFVVITYKNNFWFPK